MFTISQSFQSARKWYSVNVYQRTGTSATHESEDIHKVSTTLFLAKRKRHNETMLCDGQEVNQSESQAVSQSVSQSAV